MNDILPAEIAKWRFVEETARRVFSLYGFSELRTPVVEKTELFSRGMGQDTDVVEKQMYTFIDKGDSSLTLRPEATASVMRAVIEHGLLGQEPVQKLFSIGPMFRYERPQKGRYRQFHQINCERLGESGPLSDAETLALAYDIAVALGLSDVALEVNSLGCPVCRLAFKKALQDFLEAKKESLCPDCLRRMYMNPLRVLDCKVDACRTSVEGAPENSGYLCEECRTHYDMVLAGLDALHVPYQKNPRLVRGLDYYIRTAFEMTAKGLGSQNAVGGGGRYDGLVAALGGNDVPGVGFAFGMERLLMLIPDIAEEKKGCFITALGENTKKEALRLAAQLRREGIRTELAPEKSFKVQMRLAGKSGYPICLIIGDDEMAGGSVAMKDLNTGVQEQVKQEDLLKKLVDIVG
ncbi:MAG TPA: histidine--tRNA ligase [Desulfomonilia bacterium]